MSLLRNEAIVRALHPRATLQPGVGLNGERNIEVIDGKAQLVVSVTYRILNEPNGLPFTPNFAPTLEEAWRWAREALKPVTTRTEERFGVKFQTRAVAPCGCIAGATRVIQPMELARAKLDVAAAVEAENLRQVERLLWQHCPRHPPSEANHEA